MKRSGKLSDAYDELTLSVEQMEEFIHLGEVASRGNALRNPDYFFWELNEKLKTLQTKMRAMSILM